MELENVKVLTSDPGFQAIESQSNFFSVLFCLFVNGEYLSLPNSIFLVRYLYKEYLSLPNSIFLIRYYIKNTSDGQDDIKRKVYQHILNYSKLKIYIWLKFFK